MSDIDQHGVPNLDPPAGTELNPQGAIPALDELERLKRENESLRRNKSMLEARLRDYSERLEQKVMDRTRELEALNQIAGTVSRSLELKVILSNSLNKVLEILHLDVGALFLVNDENSELILMAEQGLSPEVIDEIIAMPMGAGCPGLVAVRGEPIVENDLEANPVHSILARMEFGSMAGVPLASKGVTHGALCLVSKEKNRFHADDIRLLTMIGSEVGVAIENASLYERSNAHSKRMEQLSITDPLTGLWNRRRFYQRLKEEMRRAKRQQHAISLLILDLDNLKAYNDKLGHLKGDQALKGIAQAVTASIRRDVDSGYRYGGDEFAVILPYSDKKESAEVAERIKNTFNSFGLEGTGISIGLAQLDYAEEVDDFVTRADTAMYAAKKTGGDSLHIDTR
jgi:diguanylate cyclase (GGDEF)-like protein